MSALLPGKQHRIPIPIIYGLENRGKQKYILTLTVKDVSLGLKFKPLKCLVSQKRSFDPSQCKNVAFNFNSCFVMTVTQIKKNEDVCNSAIEPIDTIRKS